MYNFKLDKNLFAIHIFSLLYASDPHNGLCSETPRPKELFAVLRKVKVLLSYVQLKSYYNAELNKYQPRIMNWTDGKIIRKRKKS